MNIKRDDAYKLINEEWQTLLLEFPILSKEIPKWQLAQIKKIHKSKPIYNKKYTKTDDIIPNIKIKLTAEEKNLVLQKLFNCNFDKLKVKLKEFKAYIETNPQLIEDFKASIVNQKYDINIVDPWITDIYLLYKNIFYNVSAKMSLQNNGLFLSKNQLVNFNKWFESYKRYRDVPVANPFLDPQFTSVKSIGSKSENFDINLFSEQPMYLYVSGKAEDILNMSISTFWDSCQNLYSGEFRSQILSNVYDENTKIAYIILDVPFIDYRKNEHSITTLCRMMLRVGQTAKCGDIKLGMPSLIFTKTYPMRMGSVMQEILKKYGYKETSCYNGKNSIYWNYTSSIPEAHKLKKPYLDYHMYTYDDKWKKGTPQAVYKKIRENAAYIDKLLSGQSIKYTNKSLTYQEELKPDETTLMSVFVPIFNDLSKKQQEKLIGAVPKIMNNVGLTLNNLLYYKDLIDNDDVLKKILTQASYDQIDNLVKTLQETDDNFIIKILKQKPILILNPYLSSDLYERYILSAIKLDPSIIKQIDPSSLPESFICELVENKPSELRILNTIPQDIVDNVIRKNPIPYFDIMLHDIEKYNENIVKLATAKTKKSKTDIAIHPQTESKVNQYKFIIREIINGLPEEAKAKVVNSNVIAISFINNPSEEIQIAALSKNLYNIKYINNLSENIANRIASNAVFTKKNLNKTFLRNMNITSVVYDVLSSSTQIELKKYVLSVLDVDAKSSKKTSIIKNNTKYLLNFLRKMTYDETLSSIDFVKNVNMSLNFIDAYLESIKDSAQFDSIKNGIVMCMARNLNTVTRLRNYSYEHIERFQSNIQQFLEIINKYNFTYEQAIGAIINVSNVNFTRVCGSISNDYGYIMSHAVWKPLLLLYSYIKEHKFSMAQEIKKKHPSLYKYLFAVYIAEKTNAGTLKIGSKREEMKQLKEAYYNYDDGPQDYPIVITFDPERFYKVNNNILTGTYIKSDDYEELSNIMYLAEELESDKSTDANIGEHVVRFVFHDLDILNHFVNNVYVCGIKNSIIKDITFDF